MDLEKAIRKFIQYTEEYDLNDENIKRKQTHSIRVMNRSKEIAQKLNLTQEEIDLATLIGLLHDIARFEQYKQYHTYKDNLSIDHGDLGVEILNKDIRKYIETDKYDETIKLAVKNHNKYKIQEGLTPKQELFAKIIRDADKIDIYYDSAENYYKGREYMLEETNITPEVLEQFENYTNVNGKTKRTLIDEIVSRMAFIYDFNFDMSFEILKKEDYINKTLNRFQMKDLKDQKNLEKIRNIANEYINSKIK